MDILRTISGGKINKEFGVSEFEILKITAFEASSNLIYLLLFFVLASFLKKINTKGLNEGFQYFVLFSFSISSVFTLIFPSIFDSALWFFKGSFSNMGAICSVILLVRCVESKQRTYLLIAVLNIILIFAVNMIAGLRGSIVGIVLILLAYSYTVLPSHILRKMIYISIFPVLLVVFIGSYLGELKYQFAVNASSKEFELKNIVDYYNFVTEFMSPDLLDSKQADSKSILDEIEFRYGAPSLFGVGFIRMYDRGASAGFNTEFNSLYSFLPREIVGENKPVSGSVDGTEQGMGMYSSYKEITGSDSVMSDFYVSGHYYWQFGFLGVVVLSALASIYTFFVLLFVNKYFYVGHALWLVSFKPFWLLPKLWFSEIIIMCSTIFLPTLFVIFMFRTIYIVKRTFLRSKLIR